MLRVTSQARRDRHLEACFGCLAAMCTDKGNWPELLQGNLLRIATDVLGPPPPGFIMWEFMEFQLWGLCGASKSIIQATHPSMSCSGSAFNTDSLLLGFYLHMQLEKLWACARFMGRQFTALWYRIAICVNSCSIKYFQHISAHTTARCHVLESFPARHTKWVSARSE